MENSENKPPQTRLATALILSAIVLFGWSYFFTPRQDPDAANTNANANTASTAPASPTPAATAEPQAAADVPAADEQPNRTITISSPLYELKLDSKGAVATSWIIRRNVSPKGEFPVFADGSTPENEKPLQLISDEALGRSPREVPFRLALQDAADTAFVNDRNYGVSAADSGRSTLR